MKWNRMVRALGVLTILCFFAIVMTPISNIAGKALSVQPELIPADAIVVLGSGLMPDSTLGYESQQRFLYGLRLYKKGLAPLVILSGPARPHTEPESTIRAQIASELGVPRSAILEMPEIKTTREEALEAVSLLKAKNLKHVLLVTEALHMRRSKMIFERVGLRVSAAPSDAFPEYARSALDRLKLMQDVLKHSAGLLYYRIAGYI